VKVLWEGRFPCRPINDILETGKKNGTARWPSLPEMKRIPPGLARFGVEYGLENRKLPRLPADITVICETVHYHRGSNLEQKLGRISSR
jgi:hypothetical protein